MFCVHCFSDNLIFFFLFFSSEISFSFFPLNFLFSFWKLFVPSEFCFFFVWIFFFYFWKLFVPSEFRLFLLYYFFSTEFYFFLLNSVYFSATDEEKSQETKQEKAQAVQAKSKVVPVKDVSDKSSDSDSSSDSSDKSRNLIFKNCIANFKIKALPSYAIMRDRGQSLKLQYFFHILSFYICYHSFLFFLPQNPKNKKSKLNL